MDEIATAKVLTIRECGHDEYWLRDRIFEGDDARLVGVKAETYNTNLVS